MFFGNGNESGVVGAPSHVYMYTCMFVSLSLSLSLYLSIHIYMYMKKYILVYTCVYICIYIYVFVYVYIYIFMYDLRWSFYILIGVFYYVMTQRFASGPLHRPHSPHHPITLLLGKHASQQARKCTCLPTSKEVEGRASQTIYVVYL